MGCELLGVSRIVSRSTVSFSSGRAYSSVSLLTLLFNPKESESYDYSGRSSLKIDRVKSPTPKLISSVARVAPLNQGFCQPRAKPHKPRVRGWVRFVLCYQSTPHFQWRIYPSKIRDLPDLMDEVLGLFSM